VDNLTTLCYKLANAWSQRFGRGWLLPTRRQLRNAYATETTQGRHRLLVQVRDNNVDQALKALKKKMQREGIFREMKLRNYYEKPSEKRVREQAEAVRRARKLARKRAQREGLLPGKAATKPGPGGAKTGGRPGGPSRGGAGGPPRSGGFGGGGFGGPR
jgi:small subunit ribosomal protein S21